MAQAEVDAGAKAGVTSGEREEIGRLKAEVGKLCETNEVLKAAAAFFPRAEFDP